MTIAMRMKSQVHTLPAFFPANSQAVVPHNPTTVQPQVGQLKMMTIVMIVMAKITMNITIMRGMVSTILNPGKAF